jgi:hypothetical protein
MLQLQALLHLEQRGEDEMLRTAIAVLTFALLALPATASPILTAPAVPDSGPAHIVEVATKSQRNAGYRSCRRQYGSRLAFVTFRGNRFVCHFRKSNKELTRQASRSCRKGGMKLQRVTSIRIKGNKSVTRFVCKRR